MKQYVAPVFGDRKLKIYTTDKVIAHSIVEIETLAREAQAMVTAGEIDSFEEYGEDIGGWFREFWLQLMRRTMRQARKDAGLK